MNGEYLKTVIDEFKVSNSVTSYYVTYKTADNIIRQKWGRITELGALLDEISKSDCCVSNEFPILTLIIYAELQCLIFIENEYYDLLMAILLILLSAKQFHTLTNVAISDISNLILIKINYK